MKDKDVAPATDSRNLEDLPLTGIIAVREQPVRTFAERCWSGRTGTTGNRVDSNVSWVRIPPSPPSFDNSVVLRYYADCGRTRWGTSGALYPQSALAGLNPLFRPLALRDYRGWTVLKAGSCAAEACEPRQVREEAAVSNPFWVPQGSLAGAEQPRKVGGLGARKGVRPHLRPSGAEERILRPFSVVVALKTVVRCPLGEGLLTAPNGLDDNSDPLNSIE